MEKFILTTEQTFVPIAQLTVLNEDVIPSLPTINNWVKEKTCNEIDFVNIHGRITSCNYSVECEKVNYDNISRIIVYKYKPTYTIKQSV